MSTTNIYFGTALGHLQLLVGYDYKSWSKSMKVFCEINELCRIYSKACCMYYIKLCATHLLVKFVINLCTDMYTRIIVVLNIYHQVTLRLLLLLKLMDGSLAYG